MIRWRWNRDVPMQFMMKLQRYIYVTLRKDEIFVYDYSKEYGRVHDVLKRLVVLRNPAGVRWWGHKEITTECSWKRVLNKWLWCEWKRECGGCYVRDMSEKSAINKFVNPSWCLRRNENWRMELVWTFPFDPNFPVGNGGTGCKWILILGSIKVSRLDHET